VKRTRIHNDCLSESSLTEGVLSVFEAAGSALTKRVITSEALRDLSSKLDFVSGSVPVNSSTVSKDCLKNGIPIFITYAMVL